MAEEAIFRRLGPDGRYRIVLQGSEGEYELSVPPGFKIQVEWLWQVPIPDLRDMQRLLGLI